MVKNLKFMRSNKNISQQQLAEVIGISQQSINKYENHSVEPDIEILIKLADYFNTSIDFLVGNTDIEHKIEYVEKTDLNNDEKKMIENYRKLNDNQKEALQNLLKCFDN